MKTHLLVLPFLFLLSACSLSTPVAQENKIIVKEKNTHLTCNKRDIIEYEEHCMSSFNNEEYKLKYKAWEDCTTRASKMFCN